MAVNKTLLVYIAFDIVFLALGGVLIGLPLAEKKNIQAPPNLNTIAQNLLFDECPLTSSAVNGILMCVAFLISVPGMFLSKNRMLPLVHVWSVLFCALFTLGVGLFIWFETLQTKQHLETVWDTQGSNVLSLLQHKFQCCGFKDPTKFVVDDVCTDAVTASRLGLCQGPFSAFGNSFLDIVFTSMFGICAVDGLLILSALCIIKERGEQARYRMIDEKNGYGTG